jgi:hypothetical protein
MRTGSAGLLATGLAGSLLAGGPAAAASAMPEVPPEVVGGYYQLDSGAVQLIA